MRSNGTSHAGTPPVEQETDLPVLQLTSSTHDIIYKKLTVTEKTRRAAIVVLDSRAMMVPPRVAGTRWLRTQ
jgi:hypothetical protein